MNALAPRPAPAEISIKTLAEVEAATRLGRSPYRIVDRIAQELLGHNFCTVMRWWPETYELERIYSSRPKEYPVGGRKSKHGLTWTDKVIHGQNVYIGASPEDLVSVFDDHEALAALGLGAVINTPIVLDGSCLGTFNLLNGAGGYRPGDERVTRVLAHLLTPMLSRAHP